MSRQGRRLACTSGAVAVLLLTAGVAPAYAGNSGPPGPFSPNDPTSSGTGIPGWFVFMFILVAFLGVGITIWKVTTAQKLARQSGMDPGLATQMTLLSDDGLDATYLAANLRRTGVTADQPATTTRTPSPEPPPRSVAQRLAELKSLLDQGLITPSEYDARRQALIDTV